MEPSSNPVQWDRQYAQALALGQAGRFAEAIEAGEPLLDLAPDDPRALQLLSAVHHNRALEFEQRNQLTEAAQHYRRAIELQPQRALTHYCLGNVLRVGGFAGEAIAEYTTAVTLAPDYAEAHGNLGGLLARQARPDEALQHLEIALRLNPSLATAHSNLGGVYKDIARVPEAVEAYRRAIALDPKLIIAHSGLIYAMHFDARYDPDTIYRETLNWARQHAEPFYPAPALSSASTYPNSRNPNRRLRIGYVSPHFSHHVVGMFIEPLLARHDHEQFEITCYASVVKPDAATDRFRSYADHWIDARNLDDDAFAARIRADQIDILVDLTGHIEENRLLVFARKPAPVQVTYLGYPDTTGLSTIGYRFTDAHQDPPGATDRWHTEKLARIPDSAWCFRPYGDIPAISDLPLHSAGHVTFASLNIIAKVQAPVIETWARILRDVPNSRLMLLVGNSAKMAEHIQSRFMDLGVEASRLTLVPRLPRNEYLRLMDQIDIALDPFPFNGHTTSLDLLYQGIPFVTLEGTTHVQRAGVTLLMNVGLQDLIARDMEDYVRIARELAGDASRLTSIRSTLRERMTNSALMDEGGFARKIESLYRQMWQRWCASAESPAR